MTTQDIKITDIHVGHRLRSVDDAKVLQLMSSIEEVGTLLQPVVIRRNGHGFKLVAGAHRLEAFKRLERDTIPANIVALDDLDAQLAEIDENLMRNELPALEMGEHLLKRQELWEEKYPQTKQGAQGGWHNNKTIEKLDKLENEKVSFSSDTAQKIGISERAVQLKTRIARNLSPETKDLLRGTETAANQSELLKLADMPAPVQEAIAEKLVSGEAKSVVDGRRIVKGEEVKKAAPLPSSKYKVIYADPPWSYGNQHGDNYGNVGRHYATMSIDELCDLPIEDMAEDNAALFMWVTSPLLEDAFKVINAWGFKYKSSFVWDKVRHNFGYYNSVRHEFLLVATRGSCTPEVSKLFDSVVSVERTEKHSEKPQEFRDIIETLYPSGNKVELFARANAAGWDAWGNEVAQ